jgi:hypothetical protein
MLQARHVRPALARKGELNVACTGLMVACISFFFLTILPYGPIRESTVLSTIVLYSAATGLAYVSATVVTGLTAAAAACCDEEGEVSAESLRRGRALGGFRSRVSLEFQCRAKLTLQGQLGRAIGPLLASSAYWLAGPVMCYVTIGLCLQYVTLQLRSWLSDEATRKQTVTRPS